MGRRQRFPSVAYALLLLTIAAVVVAGFFGFGDPRLQAAVRSLYFQSADTLPSILPLGSPMPPLVRRVRRPEKFVIVPSESTVAYHVTESFLTLNKSDEVMGITHAIHSEITIDRANVRNTQVGPVSVDISTFQSDNVHRDNAIRAQWLESSQYPIAEFTPVEIRGLPYSYPEGRTVPLEVIGNLRMHGVVRPARFALQLTLHGNTLEGQGTSTIHMTEFGVRPPSFGVLRVSDQVTLDLQFTARRVDIDASAHRRSPRWSSKPAPSSSPGAGPNGAPLSALHEAMCGTSLAIGSRMLETGAPSDGIQPVEARRGAICDNIPAPGSVKAIPPAR